LPDFLTHYAFKQFPLNYSACETRYTDLYQPLKKLIPIHDQTAALSASFLYTSYGVTWLGEKVHPFMTKELIIILFKLARYSEDQDCSTQGKESWTAKTRIYQTELLCTLSEINALVGGLYRFSTDKCKYNTDPIPDPNGTQAMIYIMSYHKYGLKYNYLVKTQCKGSTMFLATWAKSRNDHNRSDGLDLNPLYCKPSYDYQTHEVTVDGTFFFFFFFFK